MDVGVSLANLMLVQRRGCHVLFPIQVVSLVVCCDLLAHHWPIQRTIVDVNAFAGANSCVRKPKRIHEVADVAKTEAGGANEGATQDGEENT